MTPHLFIHRFTSGNVASVRLTPPRPGHPVHYLVRWGRAQNADDMAEYSIWRTHIIANLEQTVGRRFRMTDAAEERLTTA